MKDYFGYQDKLCVVTGASSGMGKATTEMLVDLGARVYALDINPCPIEGIERFIKVNLGDKASIDAAFAELPERFDKFFGVAGVAGDKTDVITTFTINFIGNKYITDEYLPKRISDGPCGAIAYVASIAGAGWVEGIEETQDICECEGWDATSKLAYDKLVVKNPHVDGSSAYNLSKRALIYYMMTKLDDFGKRNIRLNCIGPGFTKTALYQAFVDRGGGEENVMDMMSGGIKRFAEASDQAAALIFLNSDLAPYVSGQLLFIDGGFRGKVESGVCEFDLMAGPILTDF